ncbi:MAG: hypothetical protein JNL08_17960 [Planctomycetes bacterium]|nr:hypothetical protein [Planctomycetota bacterium]
MPTVRAPWIGRLATWCALAVAVPSQHGDAAAPTAAAPVTAPAKASDRPTHTPRLQLPPVAAWQHLRAGNDAFVRAQADGTDPPAPAERPAGAGRYVCAVIACADADVDVAALLGLRRRDVLLLSVPGPFVAADTVALLEQAVAECGLSLVVVLGHADCRTLATQPGATPNQDATAQRLAAARADAERDRAPLLPHLLRAQCLRLLAASDLLRQHADADTLRVLPAELDARSGRVVWHHQRGEQYALRPVR